MTPPSPDVAAGISRCAAALEDLSQLRTEVSALRVHSEEVAVFATALFDLERARLGDGEARAQLLEVADSLLVFWRERTGDALADSHPALSPLWTLASELLASFEVKRFQRALDACWESRLDAARLQVAIEGLLPAGNRRVEFAACLYHLELARLFVDSSRAQFARRAGLVQEAYLSKEVAEELVGEDKGLQHLWRELIPYLDEFFEALEDEQDRRRRAAEAKTGPIEAVPAKGDATPVHGSPAATPVEDTTLVDALPSPRDRTDPAALIVTPDAGLPKVMVSDTAGVFDLYLREQAGAAPLASEAIEVLEPEPLPEPVRGPPPPPSNFTPAPGSMAALQIPPPPTTAPHPPPNNDSGILELGDIVEELPPPPPRPSRRPVRASLDVELDGYEPNEAAQTFWRHTEAALGLLPPAEAPRMDRRTLSAEGRAERKKLNGWLEGVTRRFDTVPEARAFACLMRLYMAAQLKEKSLFGGVNAKRREAFASALELLSAEPQAAGHCAVWFELDGKETLDHLSNGLEVLTDYLQFCARQNLDPLDPQVPGRFLG
jgi:hypothetical protein